MVLVLPFGSVPKWASMRIKPDINNCGLRQALILKP
jgi:hypothetical protein